jgi:hypothetical protein
VEWTADYDGLTVAPLDLLGGDRTFHACDLAAAVEEGTNPDDFDIVECWRVTASGRQPGLRRVRLLSGDLVDLVNDDFGAALIRQCDWAREQHGRPWLHSLTKRYAQIASYGMLGRKDVASLDDPVEHIGYGPGGIRMAVTTAHPETIGPHGWLALAAAQTAQGRLLLAMAKRKVRDLGSEVAACNTDSIVVPCDETGSWFDCPGAPDGKLRHLTPGEFQDLLASFEPLGVHWKIEAGPTMGLVVGTNKVILGHRSPDGIWEIERSSDTNSGGVIADASDTPGQLLPDGRWAWAAEVQKGILAAAASPDGQDLSRPLPVGDPPDWAYERPALRRFQASRWSSLKRLRQTVGDPSVGAHALYLRAETGGDGPAPVALGPGWDPRTWPNLDWRINAEPVGLEVLTPDGLRFVGGNLSARRVVVRSVADHMVRWLDEQDPSVEGPERGLRRLVPVFSTRSATRVVGRHGEALLAPLYEDPETSAARVDQLDYGTVLPGGLDLLRRQVGQAGVRKVARQSGVPVQSLHDWLSGAKSSEDLVIAAAVALEQLAAIPARICALDGCDRPVTDPRSKWCGGAHRAKGSRVARGLEDLGQPRSSWAREAEGERAWKERQSW